MFGWLRYISKYPIHLLHLSLLCKELKDLGTEQLHIFWVLKIEVLKLSPKAIREHLTLNVPMASILSQTKGESELFGP